MKYPMRELIRMIGNGVRYTVVSIVVVALLISLGKLAEGVVLAFVHLFQ